MRYIRDVLTRAGYLAIVARDLGETLPLVENERPHAMVLDLALPGTDGIDLMIETAELTQALETRAAEYIVKPLSSIRRVAVDLTATEYTVLNELAAHTPHDAELELAAPPGLGLERAAEG